VQNFVFLISGSHLYPAKRLFRHIRHNHDRIHSTILVEPRHQRKQRDAPPGLHQIASNNLLFAVIGALDEDVGRNGLNQRQWGKVIKQDDEVHGP
jgi:hypothetical protein